nr:hypothetical protein [Tanacetum cinerariifolium]
IEPNKLIEALEKEGWVIAMEKELNQFVRKKVWTLVFKPYWAQMGVRNKMDEEGVVTKNKARLVAKGVHIVSDGCKSAFLNRKISEEVYVEQPTRFESSEFPNHDCKLNKALYGLNQAPRACEMPYASPNNLGHDESGVFVNETQFKGIIGSLMYLTASRTDIQFTTCLCARYQANPKESHLVAVKRIFRYLKGTPNLGLWYPKGSGFDLKAYLDSDYAGCNLDRKTEAKYIVAARCCAQVVWIKSQLADYNVLYDKEFWYTTEVEKETNTINFSLSWWDEPLSFTQKEFISAIGLPVCKNPVPPPPKETVRAGLATLGVNADDTADKSLSRASEQPVT